MVDYVYFLLFMVESFEQILCECDIDVVLFMMGGQMVLNLVIEAGLQGFWEKYDVRFIGVDLDVIELVENWEVFWQYMIDNGLVVVFLCIVNFFLEGKEVVQEIGFLLVICFFYILGGIGGGFVYLVEEFDVKLCYGLNMSLMYEVLVEKVVFGWKEYELEFLCDVVDNVVIICMVENFDLMGIYMGDLIMVVLVMMFLDMVYQEMCDQVILVMCLLGNFVGGCNIQFLINLEMEELIVIEINLWVSCFLVLVSKVIGYLIVKIVVKFVIGYMFDELKNQIIKIIFVYFEFMFDYVIVKMFCWNFFKFLGVDYELGLQMKLVGEVMGIGCNFLEVLQKVCQSLEQGCVGLGVDKKEWIKIDDIFFCLEKVSDDCIFCFKDVLCLGVLSKIIYKLIKIDFWFIQQIKCLVEMEECLMCFNVVEDILEIFMCELKVVGFFDV